MRLLLDEDSQGKVFVRLLREAGHDVETVTAAGLSGNNDAAVLAFAKESGRVLITRNVRDFLTLHAANPEHHGVLLEHQDAEPSKNMSYGKIVGAIAKIEASAWDLRGEVVSLNGWA